mgnify:CR=1 FL=1
MRDRTGYEHVSDDDKAEAEAILRMWEDSGLTPGEAIEVLSADLTDAQDREMYEVLVRVFS